MNLAEMQPIVDSSLELARAEKKPLERFKAIKTYRSLAQEYNDIFNAHRGKIEGMVGYEQIYDTNFFTNKNQ